jgi:hypothetical protein
MADKNLVKVIKNDEKRKLETKDKKEKEKRKKPNLGAKAPISYRPQPPMYGWPMGQGQQMYQPPMK